MNATVILQQSQPVEDDSGEDTGKGDAGDNTEKGDTENETQRSSATGNATSEAGEGEPVLISI